MSVKPNDYYIIIGAFMKYLIRCLLLCLGILLPLTTTQAELHEEVIFLPHLDKGHDELWITDVRNTRHARKIYTHPQYIYELAVQPDGDYVVFVSDPPVDFFAADAYLIDRRHIREAARNLTKLRFDTIWDIDISHNGDIAFTNYDTGLHPDMKYGVYLIRSQELKKGTPKAELLVERESFHVRWSPDGNYITFGSWNEVYIHDVKTGVTSGIDIGWDPVFSPDGNRLAFFLKVLGRTVAISVISIHPRKRLLKTIALDVEEAEEYISNLDWTPDGESLVYTVFGAPRRTYVVPLDGSPREEILIFPNGGVKRFDWTRAAYAVEPTQKLTTLWGALKADNTHSR